MHIYRLAQFVGPGMAYQHYIGPREGIPAGWSIVTRRSLRRPHSLAAVDVSLPCAEAVAGESTQGEVA